MRETIFRKKRENSIQSMTKPKRKSISRFFRRIKNSLKTAGLFGALALSSCVFESGGMLRPDAINKDSRADIIATDGHRKDSTKDSTIADLLIPDTVKPDTIPHWWDTNWKYCRQIKITGPSSAGIVLSVSLDPVFFDHTHAKVDLSDLRFLEGNCNSFNSGASILSAWAQKVDSTKGSKIWFKTQTANVANIAMYYGNPLASDIFDGSKLFPLFDSFEGSSLDLTKWTCNGTCNVAGGMLMIANAPSSSFYVESVKSFGTEYVFTMRAALKGMSSGDKWDAYFGFRNTNVSNPYPYIIWVYDGQTIKYAAQGTSASQYTTSVNSPTDNNFHTWRIDRNPTSADYHYDGILMYNLIQYYPTGAYPIILHTNHAGVTIEADWIFVRPLVKPVPTYTIGPETTQ